MYGAKHTKSVQVYLTEAQHARWDDCAKQYDMALSTFVRNAVDKFIYSKEMAEAQGTRLTLAGRVAYKQHMSD